MSNPGIDAAVAQMGAMVCASQHDLTIRAWSRLIAGGPRFATPASKAKALHEAIKLRTRYNASPAGLEYLTGPCVPFEGCGLDADEEAVLLSTCCATLGLATTIRAVQVGEYAWTVVVDVDGVTFKMGEEASDGR